jgi:hypothetical protein
LKAALTSWSELDHLVMVFFWVSLFCLCLLCCGSARLGSMFCPSTWDQFADNCPVWCCSDTIAGSVCTLRFPFFLETSTFLRSNLWRMQSVNLFPMVRKWMPLSNAWCGLSKYIATHIAILHAAVTSYDSACTTPGPCLIMYLRHGHKCHWRLWTKFVSAVVLE